MSVITIFYLGITRILKKKVIFNFIFYNYLNSIHKLIYDRERKDNTYTMSKYLLFSFSFLFMPFFLTSLVAIFFFHLPLAFFFFFSCLFFFLLLEYSYFSSFSFLFFWGPCVDSCLSSFSFLFSGACRILFFLILVFLFLFSGGLVFSLSPSIARTSRSKSIPNCS